MFYMYGEASLQGCDLWSATTDWDIYSFDEGVRADPFVDGAYEFTLPGVGLTCKRMPMEFPVP